MEKKNLVVVKYSRTRKLDRIAREVSFEKICAQHSVLKRGPLKNPRPLGEVGVKKIIRHAPLANWA